MSLGTPPPTVHRVSSRIVKRLLAATAGLFLTWHAVGTTVAFAGGRHSGYGPIVVFAGALIGVIVVLAWAALRGRDLPAWRVLAASLLGSWAPMLASAAAAGLARESPLSFNDVLFWWLVWAAGGIISLLAPLGFWLLWVAIGRKQLSRHGAA
jgi:hypothetical protein